VRVRLEGGHEPVEPERQDAGAGAPRLRVSDLEATDRYVVVMQDPQRNEVCLP
jgi:hypothetical protein